MLVESGEDVSQLAIFACSLTDLTQLANFFRNIHGVHKQFRVINETTMHLVVPMSHDIMTEQTRIQDGELRGVRQLKNAIRHYMRVKVLNKIDDIHWIATMLCPTFKKDDYFLNKWKFPSTPTSKNSVSFDSKKKFTQIQKQIKAYLKDIKDWDEQKEEEKRAKEQAHRRRQLAPARSESMEPISQSVINDAPRKQPDFMVRMLANSKTQSQSIEPRHERCEYDTFLSLPHTSKQLSLSLNNPLCYWQKDTDVKHHGMIRLQRLSRWVYVKKASEASVESMFSLSNGWFAAKKNPNTLDVNTESTFKVHRHRKNKLNLGHTLKDINSRLSKK